jgi:hypothetical protein
MDTKKKEEALLMLLQVLDKACDDMEYIAQGLNTEQKNLLNVVNDTVLDAKTVIQDVLMQDKKDDLLVNKLQSEFTQVLDFLSENRLMVKFIEHKSKYTDE